MSDKISDEQLLRIAQAETADIGGGQSPIVTAMAIELIARRAAEVKPVELPEPAAYLIWGYAGSGPDDYYDTISLSFDKDDVCADGTSRYPVYAGWQIHDAIKAAGGTVKDGE